MEGTLDDGRLDAAETATTDATGSGWMHAIKLDNPSYYHMPRCFRSASGNVTTSRSVKTANISQIPLVTLPTSHSHHVIRTDPATQLKNVSVQEDIT